METKSLVSPKPLLKLDLFLHLRIERMTEEERVEFFTNNNIEIDGKVYYLPQEEKSCQ